MMLKRKVRWLRKSSRAQQSSKTTALCTSPLRGQNMTKELSTNSIYYECSQGDSNEFIAMEVGDGNQDPRFTMTDWERVGVDRLQQACQENHIHYNSLFELVKYVLVARSCCKDNDPDADRKRLKRALNRIKMRREFEAKYSLNEICLTEALEKVASVMPEYFISDYTCDIEGGHVAVAHGPSENPWIHQSKENLACMLKVELHRCDLAAANLEEARKGMAFVVRWGEGGFSIRASLAYVRAITRCREMILPCHNHRMKRIYVQTSPMATAYVNMVKRLLPAKLAQRVAVVSTVKQLHELVESVPDSGEVPTVNEWVAERQKIFDLTLQKLH